MKWLKNPIFILIILVGVLLGVFFADRFVFAGPYGRGAYNTCEYGGNCSLAISTSSTVELEVEPSASGVFTIEKDEVEVTTSSVLGYTLTLEMDSDSVNALTAPEGTVASTTATEASPAVLTGNQWGFRVDGEASFGMGPTTAVTNQSSSSLTFAGIPLLGSPVTVKSTDTDAPTGDVTNVWYGIRAGPTQPAGSYTGTVVYTAVTL